ncbi:MAG: DUF2849 domain-containing protein [Gammaproteobacteria bacterium]|nr:DUF2849 domain-containing protein [Gammaproteobacteria bacterium]
MPQVVIANSLTDGFVVFLTDQQGWSGDIADAAVADDEDAAGQLLAVAATAEQSNRVIDPYLIEVEIGGKRPRPLEYREYIRAYGPTVDIPS